MVTFWLWCVRNPGFTVAAIALCSGLTGVVDWSLAMSATAVGAIVGDCGRHLAKKAEARAERRQAARMAEIAAIERFTDYSAADEKAA